MKIISKFLDFIFKSNETKIEINKKTYRGGNVSISSSGVVVIDGYIIEEHNKIDSIVIYGDVESMEVPYAEKLSINGNVKDLSNTSGDILVNGNVENIRTTSGDIEINGDVGNATSVSGDVKAKKINGRVTTTSGDVKNF